jgi:hypothetical protein
VSIYGDVLPFDVPDWTHLTVGPVSTAEGADFVRRWHYAGGGAGSCTHIGLYRGVQLVGTAAFGTPVSGDAAASVFGPEHQDRVMDLQRFVLVDEAPGNTESWFLVRALRAYKAERPQTWAVTSFADSSQGHRGVIYQATNAIYGGVRSAETQFVDSRGRLRANRMDGKRVSPAQAHAWGWEPVRRQGKHRYLFLTPDDRAHRRHLMRLLRWTPQPYPKRDEDAA